MHGDTRSWSVTFSLDGDLSLAVYIKDVENLDRYIVSEPDVGPLLSAPKADESTLIEKSDLVRQWPEWWSRLVADGLSDDALPVSQNISINTEYPALAISIDRHISGFNKWLVDQSRREPVPESLDFAEMISELEGNLGRDTNPFHLNVRIIPLKKSQGWLIGPRRVILSSSLLDSTIETRNFFQPILRDIM